ncbi:hypothetical protein Awo_c23160 [Acetobacterium woodii DSM 1030]|uniref:Uncharacterized protein n=1 Tax=Acetobacterium woodii (strain ATCC 29683 / DSM 1030 / JCM 2381 / KCTC 1655 / WB1) TaxID=931626 RepID=H6LCV2_ACEWD|nr:hypothetical protein Awo_c23160 [Acetobacterium woodii DSM 1030]
MHTKISEGIYLSRGNLENLLKVPEVETFLKNRVIEKKELFLGIRDESIIIYYWGKKMMELVYQEGQKCIVKISKFFIDRTAFCGLKFTQKSDLMIFPFNQEFVQAFVESYLEFKENVENALIESAPIEAKAGPLGQKYQGIIACNNNANINSDWYCVDLNYSPEGTPLGRIDMVAISKQKQNGRHRMVLLSCKYSWQAYKSGYRKNLYNNKKNKGYYIEANGLKTKANAKGDQHRRRFGCKYDEKKQQIVSYEFGSGIIGDFYNYAQLIFTDHGKLIEGLKAECFDILKAKKSLGCFEINDKIGAELLLLLAGTKETFMEAIGDMPECVFLTVGCGDTTEKAKQAMAAYLRPGPTSTADVFSITQDKWVLCYNNGKGKSRAVARDLSLTEAFPVAFEERVRYLFTRKIALENLNIIDHPDACNGDELKIKIFE